jgi:hypothetical protein
MMAKLNATEIHIREFCRTVLPSLEGNASELGKKIAEAADLGIRSYDSVRSMRPLVAAVWRGMCDRNDPDRFVVGGMLQELDNFLAFWVMPDDKDVSDKE